MFLPRQPFCRVVTWRLEIYLIANIDKEFLKTSLPMCSYCRKGSIPIINSFYFLYISSSSAVRTLTGLGRNDPELDFHKIEGFIANEKCPDCLWGPTSPLFMGTGGPFPGDKAAHLPIQLRSQTSMELYLHCPYIYSWWAQGQNSFCISFVCGDEFINSKAFILQNEEHSGSGKLKTRSVLGNFRSLIWLSGSALILGLSVDWRSNL